MTVSQKAALSLLISVFLFAGFAVLAFTGLFDLVEARFYNPSIMKSLNREIEEDAGIIQNFFMELESLFSETLREEAIRRSFLPNQSAEDIFERSRRFGVLMETLGGLQSVRFVDEGGLRIHYSTRPQDILNQDRLSIAYRNYDTLPGVLPYSQVAVQALGSVKYTLDGIGDRIIFSFPFYDSFEIYRGTALFSLSARAIAERFVGAGRIKVGDDVSIIMDPPGIVTGAPRSTEKALLPVVASIWQDGIVSLTPLNSAESDATLALISFKTDQGILTGRLVSEALFAFPNTMKAILLVAFFLTVYLVIFLFFNLRQDTMTIVQDRLKNLQISLIEQYYDRKGDVDWNHWSQELEQRREDIRFEIKRGIKIKKGQRAEEDIDSLINKSWDELLTVIGNRRQTSGIDEEKLQSILNRILRSVPGLPAAGSAVGNTPMGAGAPVGPVQAAGGTSAEEAVEELAAEEPEEAEEVEELEDAEEVEELAAEEPEEAEAVEELGDAEEVEELAGEPEEAEDTSKAAAAKTPETVVPPGGGLLAAADKKKTSNIKLAIGDDDIPYIVESSGLELVDEDVDLALGGARADEEPAVLEELEEEDIGTLDEAGKPEELEELEEIPAGRQEPSPLDIDSIASQIEFSDTEEAKDGDGSLHDEDLEITSPFTTMLSNITQEQADTAEGETEPPLPSVEEAPDNDDPDAAAADEKKN